MRLWWGSLWLLDEDGEILDVAEIGGRVREGWRVVCTSPTYSV